ncbi:signal peptidase I [Pseudolysinimonas sp.]|uniref:signal peptidase I n=1 Tax=Pseudolysinimonas sp. TaxID=2680009 RepID=UPI003F7F50FA
MTLNDTAVADPADDAPASSRRRGGAARFLRDVLIIIVAAILISFLIKTFLIRSFYIPSQSMEDTLLVNDRIIVNELQPKVFPLQRGDVVVFKDPGGWLPPSQPDTNPIDWALSIVGLTAPDSNDHLIKRLIGLPGDHVTCCNSFGQISVNGSPLDEPYIKLPTGVTQAAKYPFDVTVPKGYIWVEGDNRYDSDDSVEHNHDGSPDRGFMPMKNVVGRAILITWPVDRWTWLDNHPLTFADVGTPGDAKAGDDRTDESSAPTPTATTSGR